MTNDILYETPVVRIGKHEWRALVLVHGHYGAVIQYRWRRLPSIPGTPAGPWRADTEWPGYDHNDGQTAGLPRSLKKRLYIPRATEIKTALARGRAQESLRSIQ